MTVKEIMNLIKPSSSFRLSDIDDKLEPKIFNGIDSFEISELYGSIKDYEVLGVSSDKGILNIDYGVPVAPVKLELNIEDGKLLKNILIDKINELPKNNFNKDFILSMKHVINKIDSELSFWEED